MTKTNKKIFLPSLGLLLALAGNATVTPVYADQFDAPLVAGEFTGTITGSVKWVHQSGNWFMMKVDEITPAAGDAVKFDELKTKAEGLKVGLSWNGPKPNAEMKAYFATLKPGQAIALQLKPNFEVTGVQLAAVPTDNASATNAATPAVAGNGAAMGATTGERGPNVFDLDADKLGTYNKVNRGFKNEKSEGEFAAYKWALGAWDAASQVEMKNAEVGGKKAIALTNLEGKPSLMFYQGGLAPVKAGQTVVAEVEYRTAGSGTLVMEIGAQKQNFAMPTSAEWKKATFSMTAEANGALKTDFRNGAMGADNTLYIRPLYVGIVSGGGGATEAVAAAPVAQPVVAGMTDARSKEGLTGLYQSVMYEELNALPIKRWMFAKDEAGARDKFNLQKFEGATGQTEKFDVTGQPFKTATRVTVSEKPKLFWHLNYTGFDQVGAQKGDRLFGVMYYRVTGAPEGVGKMDATLSQQVGDDWKPMWHEDYAPTQSDEWERVYFNGVAAGDGPVRLWTNVGGVTQTVEFGGLTLVNMGPNVAADVLPKNELNLNYKGREADAQWRKDAQARIEKFRKGDFTVKVVDAAGKAVPGANVKLEMTRHAYPFGTAVAPFEFRANKAKYRGKDFRSVVFLDTPDGEKYRKALTDNFNFVTFSPGWRVWDAPNLKPVVNELGDMLEDDEMMLKMHVLLYPRSDQIPDKFKQAGTPEEFKRELLAYVRDVMTTYKGKIKFYDVINEPNSAVYAKNLYQPADKYYDFLAELFKTAHAADPDAKLYINETGWEGKDSGKPTRAYLKTLVDEIRQHGGEVDGLGFQYHVGATMPPPAETIAVLDEVAKWNVDFGLSEFDSKVPGPQTAEVKAYQADALRDSLYIAFSQPRITNFIMWDFWDARHWLDNAPLYEEDWTPKPALAVWKDLVFNKWWTNANGKAGATGAYQTRGYFGDYRVTATANGVTQTVDAKLDKTGDSVTVKLG